MAYGGLETLFQNLGPVGAYYAGQREADARLAGEQESLKRKAELAKMQEELLNAQLSNPIAREQGRLQNLTTDAALPGVQANSQKAGFEAQKMGATLPSTIRAVNSNNIDTLDENGQKAFMRMGQYAGVLASQLEGTPPIARHSVVTQFMDSQGIPKDNPIVQKAFAMLEKIPAEKLPAFLKSMSDKILTSTPEYKKSFDIAEMNRASQERIAAGNNRTSVEVANLNNDTKLRVAEAKKAQAGNVVSAVMSGKVSPDKALAAFQTAAAAATTDEERAYYQDLSARMQTIINNSVPGQGLGAKPNAAAVAGMPGSGGNNPYEGTKPKPGTKENPIKLD